MTRAIIVEKKRQRSGRLNFQTTRPLCLGFTDSGYADCYRSRRDCQCLPDRFCASLSSEQKPPGSALPTRRERERERADKCRRLAAAKIVIFGFRSYFFGAGDKPTRYRRARGKSDEPRTTSAGGRSTCAEGSIRIRHCGILNSFFSFLFCADLSSRLHTAVVDTREHPSVQRSCT